MNLPAINVRQRISRDITTVFNAIASSEGLNQWFTTRSVIEPRVGGVVRFRWENVGTASDVIEDAGEVLDYQKPNRFSFTWKPGATVTEVTITLSSVAEDETELHLSEKGHRENDDDLNALVDCAAGWGEACMALKMFLEHGIVARPR